MLGVRVSVGVSLYIWCSLSSGIGQLLVFAEVTTGDYSTVSVTSSGPAGSNGVGKQGGRPIDRGLQPLYVMTNTFLDLIQPNPHDDFLANVQFDHVFEGDDAFQKIKQSFTSNWQPWMKHYVGYTICLAVGVVFIVIMPLIGICFCLCRCCGCCGAKKKQPAKKGDGCKRSCCGIILIVFTTLLMAGMVCAFVTNGLIHEQTSVKESQLNISGVTISEFGVMPTIISSLRSLDNYKKDILSDLRTSIATPVRTEVDRINGLLTDFPIQARDKLSEMANLDKTLTVADLLASSLENISLHLQIVQDCKNTLIQLQNQLNSSINESKTNILNALPPECHLDSQCVKLRAKVRSLQVGVDFSQAQNLSSHLNAIRTVIDDQFRASIENGKMSYINVTKKFLDDGLEEMKNRINQVQKDITSKSDKILVDVENLMKSVTDILNNIDFRLTENFVSTTVVPKVNEYGYYRYCAGLGLSCVLLVWVLLTYLGLCFGACGESAGDDVTACCNRGNGACLLMTSVAFIFLFCWLLMIVVVGLFGLGGAVYTEVCHPLLNQHSSTLMKIGDRYLASKLNRTEGQITVLGFLGNCENDDGLYTSLNLEPVFNLTGQLDVLLIDIKVELDNMVSQIKPDLSQVDIADSDMLKQLYILKDSQLDFINFTSYDVLLSEPVTSTNLLELAEELHNATKQLPETDWTRTIDREATKLQVTANTIVASMQNTSKHLRAALAQLRSEIQPQSSQKTFSSRTQDLIDTLNETQNFIRFNGSSVIKQFVTTFAFGIYEDCSAFLINLNSKIQNKVSNCRPLYDTIMLMTGSVCQYLFNPFNGFWFSIGWCLFFSIPIIIISVKLASLYRKGDDFYGSDYKSYDDPHQNQTQSLLQHRPYI